VSHDRIANILSGSLKTQCPPRPLAQGHAVLQSPSPVLHACNFLPPARLQPSYRQPKLLGPYTGNNRTCPASDFRPRPDSHRRNRPSVAMLSRKNRISVLRKMERETLLKSNSNNSRTSQRHLCGNLRVVKSSENKRSAHRTRTRRALRENHAPQWFLLIRATRAARQKATSHDRSNNETTPTLPQGETDHTNRKQRRSDPTQAVSLDARPHSHPHIRN
jgi:hypothetical protein